MSRVHQAIKRAEREQLNAPHTPLNAPPASRKEISHPIAVESLENLNPFAEKGNLDESPAPPLLLKPIALKEDAKKGAGNLATLDPRLVAVQSPHSVIGEQYRTLKARLFKMKEQGDLKTILVTSAAPSDGKTLTATNLALTISMELSQKVLLVDCDLRKPCVHHLFGMPHGGGLSDCLLSESGWEKQIPLQKVSGLNLIQAGTISEKPAEILNSQRMKDFLTLAKNEYDWIILDSPPLVPLADAELLSMMADGILLVVRSGQTPGHLIAEAIKILKNKNLLGLIFNGVAASQKSGYYYYSYGNTKDSPSKVS
jgi:capsular exopolysaccharide synthesis family protein